MARLFILFLIALLPLRGLALDRMVFQMQSPGSASGVTQATGMGEDCALHMQSANSAQDADASDSVQSDTQTTSCQSCQLCMPVAALTAPTLAAINPVHQTVPQPRTTAFASAETALPAKPPIS